MKFLFVHRYVFILCLFLYTQSKAQQPCFDVSNARGCAPLTVTVSDCSGADPNLVFYRFGGATVQQQKIFTFQEPGTYSISQLINTGGTGGDSVRRENIIQVFEPKAVDFEVLRCANRTVRVRIKDDYYDSYKIDFGDNQSEIVGDNGVAEHSYGSEREFTITVRGLFEEGAENCTPSSQIVKSVGALLPARVRRFEYFEDGSAKINYTLPTDLNHHLEIQQGDIFERIAILEAGSESFLLESAAPNAVYRISITDPCTGEVAFSQLFYVADISLVAKEKYIDISWLRVTGIDDDEFVRYKLIRNNNEVYDTTEISITRIFDKSIICKAIYCYQVEAIFSGGLTILTPKRCVSANSDVLPPTVSNLYASFTPTNQVLISWSFPIAESQTTLVKSALITRQDQSERINTFSLTSSDSSFLDTRVDRSVAPYCYTISYTNACDLVSEPSATVCPILLRAEHYTQGDPFIYLNWIGFEGLPTSNYTLDFTDSLGKEPLSSRPIPHSGSLSVDATTQERQVGYFTIKAQFGDTLTYSNTIEFIFPSYINFPNAFTPNGDNLNDTYGVDARFITDFDMIIFNKWGEGVFRTNDINTRWDGRYRNGFAPSGEYTLKIVAKDQVGREFVFTEMIKLLR